METQRQIVILLAGQRAGVVNPLAARAGVSHKCLVPIRGRELIDRVLDTLTGIATVAEIRISLEPEAHGAVEAIAARYTDRGVPVSMVPNATNIVDSVFAAAAGEDARFVITTADNVLLTAAGYAQLAGALDRADAALALARQENVLAAHPEGQRNFYRFKDGGWANCNIYALRGRRAFAAAEFFREGGQFQKNPRRLLRAVGLFNILLMKLRLVTLRRGVARLSRRMGVTIEPVEFTDGSLAIDVDNERTYACCEAILEQRERAGS